MFTTTFGLKPHDRDDRADPSGVRRISVALPFRLVEGQHIAQPDPSLGATDIPRKPNYDFERREREKNKAVEAGKKAQAKADKRAAEQRAPDAE